MKTLKIVNGDIVMNAATGRPLTVETTEKFRQDVRENLDNERQTDGTGAHLSLLVAGQTAGWDVYQMRTAMYSLIESTFNAWGALQASVQRSDRDLTERFGRIQELVVQPLKDAQGEIDMTSLKWRVNVLSQNKAGIAVTTGVIGRAGSA